MPTETENQAGDLANDGHNFTGLIMIMILMVSGQLYETVTKLWTCKFAGFRQMALQRVLGMCNTQGTLCIAV